MSGTIHDLQQGTDAWHQFRADHFGASEAAAMLGLSSKVKRSELLRAKHSGVPREFSQFVQERILDHGHEVEAAARPHAEQIIGEDLYPLTYSRGRLSASCDGITLEGRRAFEHKQWAEALAESVAAGIVPDEHMPQCQQIMLVTGAESVLFMVSDGTPDRMVHTTVTPSEEWFKRLQAGWQQFALDLATYTPAEVVEPVRATPTESLPAVSVRMDGALAVVSNLPAFGQALQAFVNRIPVKPQTDQEFADTEAACKALKRAEEALDAAESGALASIADVEAMRRMVADFRKLARDTRLAREKDVERQKLAVKEAIVAKARGLLDAHVAALDAEVRPARILGMVADWAGAIKGKRTLASVQDAVDLVLAQSKISANEAAQGIRANLAFYRAEAAGFEALFPDLGTIATKPGDDFKTLVQARVAKHKADLEARERAIREKAEADARAKAEREAAATAEAKAKAERDAATKELPEGQGPQQVLKAEPATADATDRGAPANASPGGGPMGAGQAAAAAPAVVPVRVAVDMATGPDRTAIAVVHHMPDELLARCAGLVAHLALAFEGKFPSHPKPEKAWWDGVRESIQVLQPALAAAMRADLEVPA